MIDEENSKINDASSDNKSKKSSANNRSVHSHVSNLNNNLEKSSEQRLDELPKRIKKDEERKSEKSNKSDGRNKEPTVLDSMLPSCYLIYQEMIVFHQIYTIVFFIFEFVIFVYKGMYLTFPSNALGVEISCLIFYLIIQLSRFSWGTMGNRTQSANFVLFSVIWSIGALYTYIHFHLLQTFVLRIELVLSIGGIIAWLFEVVFAIVVFMKNSEAEAGI